MVESLIAPRRITVTSAVHLFPEPRRAWRVPTTAPFAVNPEASWLIVGMVHAQLADEYECSTVDGAAMVNRVYSVAEEAAERAADWPTIRYLPLTDDALEEGTLNPRHVAFSPEDAAARAKRNKERADAEAESKPAERTRRRPTRSVVRDAQGTIEFSTGAEK